jgi:biopolymer transport protein ExbD
VAGQTDDRDDDLITSINVTPLVDVVLVLLIILMVTANAIASRSIPMDLPEAAVSEATPETLTVSLDRSGKLYLDGTEVDETELRRRIRQARQGNDDLRAVIAADGGRAHREVVRVIDLLRQERVTKFAINVRPSELDRD